MINLVCSSRISGKPFYSFMRIQALTLQSAYRGPVVALSPPSLLRIHLQLPLTEEENVPISQHTPDHPVAHFSVHNPTLTLAAEKLTTLYRVSNEESVESIQDSFRGTTNKTPPTNGSEQAFISTWDANVSDVPSWSAPVKTPFVKTSETRARLSLSRDPITDPWSRTTVFWGQEKRPDTSDN